jgi:hypothetical protein
MSHDYWMRRLFVRLPAGYRNLFLKDIVVGWEVLARPRELTRRGTRMTQATLPENILAGTNSTIVVGGTGTYANDPPPEFWPAEEMIEQQIERVMRLELSDALVSWIDAYSQVGQRPSFLWNWCRRAVELTTLPAVEADRYDEVCDTKVLGVMLDVMWDDIADQSGNDRLLDRLLDIPFVEAGVDFSDFSPAEQAYAAFTQRVWTEIHSRLRRYPRYEEFRELLDYDYRQLANVMRYSHLSNAHPELLNLVEHDLYTPHNMHIMICATIDMMCSPSFDRREIGKTRELVWYAQCMGRIGNLVTTWRRELDEHDFTSGVYASALSQGDLSIDELLSQNLDLIEAAINEGKHEQFFLDRWQRHRQFLLSRAETIRSFDVNQLVRGLEKLFCLHLGSRGRK